MAGRVARLAEGGSTERPLDQEFFRAGAWTLAFADYNGDGRVDFDPGRYAGCTGWWYALFTVDPSGRVEQLPTTAGRVPARDFSNSTPAIVPVEGGFRLCFYPRRAGHVAGRFRSDGERAVVVRDGQRLVDGCPGPP